MEIVKRIIDKLPFPIIVAISMLVLLAWGLKQYHCWSNYRGLIENKIFLIVCVSIMLNLPLYYVISYIVSKPSPGTFTIAVANFAGDEALGANIADGIEESLRGLGGKVQGIELLEGQVKNSINGEKRSCRNCLKT